jgi:hypothetical protein
MLDFDQMQKNGNIGPQLINRLKFHELNSLI